MLLLLLPDTLDVLDCEQAPRVLAGEHSWHLPKELSSLVLLSKYFVTPSKKTLAQSGICQVTFHIRARTFRGISAGMSQAELWEVSFVQFLVPVYDCCYLAR